MKKLPGFHDRRDGKGKETTSAIYRKARASLLAFVVVVMGLSVGAAVFAMVNDYLITIDAAKNKLAGYAAAIKEISKREFSVADILLQRAAGEISLRGGMARMGKKELADFLLSLVADKPQFDTIFVSDPTGRILANPFGVNGRDVNIAEREYFKFHRAAYTNNTHWGTLERNDLNQKWCYVLSRRINNPDSTFAGIVGMTIDAASFNTVPKAFNLGSDMQVILARGDGGVLVFSPLAADGEPSVSTHIAPVFNTFIAAGRFSGSYRAEKTAGDRSDRLVVYDTITEYPIIVIVSQLTAEILKYYNVRLRQIGLSAIALITLGFYLTRLSLRELAKMEMMRKSVIVAQRAILEAKEARAKAEKLYSIGTMAAGISHEINQPLNSIKMISSGMVYSSSQGRIKSPAEWLTGVEEISRQADRISKTLHHLRSVIKRDQIQLSPCDLNAAVEQSLYLVARQLAGHHITVDKQLADPLPKVICIPTALEEVVINVLNNAMQALDLVEKSDKRISIRTRHEGQVILEVGDNGPGVSPELGGGVFEPFVSTKEGSENMGLGLAIVNSIVTTYHGKVELVDGQGPGATFRISLPAAADAEREG